MPVLTPLRLLAAGISLALAGLTLPAGGAAQAAVATGETTSSSPVDAVSAQQALNQAKSLFAGRSTRRGVPAGTAGARDATLVLTRLRHVATRLSADDRADAEAILARPTYQGTPAGPYEHSYTVPEQPTVCDLVCVHRVGTTKDATTSGFAGTVATQMSRVWTTEIDDYGYRQPRTDIALADNGGDARLDVYLQDLPSGLYGYCVPDTDDVVTSGYCVLDNDYSSTEFPQNTPLQNLQVTAAHEFFHAVQFSYDSYEDPWLVEGTAAWMEDEVYDGVNDNRQYLGASALSDPYVPLDYSDDGFAPYGAWLFWTFLSEWSGPGASDDADVVRQVWVAARGSQYSTAALQRVLVARGSSFRTAFSTFGTWTANPARYFSEGSAYRTARLSDSYRLSSRSRTTGRVRTNVSHMAHRFYRFTNGSTGRWRLRVSVNMVAPSHGSVARLEVHRRDGGLKVLGIPLNADGNGARAVEFRSSVASYVTLELANASIRFDCDQGTSQSCQGVGLDDRRPVVLSATAVRF